MMVAVKYLKPDATIVHISSEVYPFSKTGGLAEVLGALPTEQAKMGLRVAVISPWYASLNGQPAHVGQVRVPGMFETVRLGHIREQGVDCFFIGYPGFDRDRLYGYSDDVERFVHFCKAVPYVLDRLNIAPDIVHTHDWQAGILPALIRFTPVPPQFSRTQFIHSVHNLQYQGRWNPWDILSWTGLPASLMNPEGMEFYGDVNLMKAGLVYSDRVVAVSSTYVQEITTSDYGEGLDGILRKLKHEGRLVGILNGIDSERWNPRTDPLADFSTPLEKKRARDRLVHRLGISGGPPILAVISRFAHQKGIDLVADALPELLKDWTVVVLGDGDPLLETVFSLLSQYVPNFFFFAGYNEPLAHEVYAGADSVLMPSRFEPCGLTQLIAMRYGTLPIVRDTGGLHDTVSPDIGFLFGPFTADALVGASRQALEAWKDREAWLGRVTQAMAYNSSWSASAGRYLDLYNISAFR